MYPDSGPLRRELYAKHLEFFALGATEPERLMLAANRVGKTEGVGGYEVALHATGLYPDWWPGWRFNKPTRIWAAGDTGNTTRDIIQAKLLGEPGELGTGLIPGDLLLRKTAKTGITDAVDTVYVRHASGGTSSIQFKSYDQGRRTFQGTRRDVVWFDEEPPLSVYLEGLQRTMSTQPNEPPGLTICTFTPLEGMSETVMYFLPEGLPQGDDDDRSMG